MKMIVQIKREVNRRLEREKAWMARLQTVYPFGLNTRIKGLGIVNLDGRHKQFNVYELSSSHDKNRKGRKKARKKR